MKQVINYVVSFVIVILVLSIATIYFFNRPEEAPQVSSIISFEECVNAGYPVMESYPRQCKTPEGKVFVETIEGEEDKSDLIEVFSVSPGQQISSPLEIQGEARGFWYFEASFPVRLLDESGNEIAFGIAQAQGDWMTEEFVPFSAILEFQTPAGDMGTLVFEKDNPSGLPENADEFKITVKFLKPTVKNDCVITGCSSHICSDADVVTTCEYLPRYECYKGAICERQQNGQCGWTQTDELIQCLSAAQ